MKTLKIFKIENEVMELSIAYALFYILQKNHVESKLINKSSVYLIEIYDDIEYTDLLLPEIVLEDLDNINSSMTRSEQEGMLIKATELLDDPGNIEMIFKYYETLNEAVLGKELKKKDGSIFVGTYTYTKGVRGYGSVGGSSHKIPLYEKVLSFLGFVQASSFFKIKDVIEINSILIPEETDVFLKAEYLIYTDKETGEIKHLRAISKKDPKTLSLANLYLLSLKKLSEETIAFNYKAIWLMQVSPTANKPLNDKMLKLPVHNFSVAFINELLIKIKYSTVDRDAKLALADYLLTQSFESYINMINVFSKANEKLYDKHLEELIELQNDKIIEFYYDETVERIGKALNRLIRDKKGYSAQVQLLSCTNKKALEQIISELSVLYYRNYGSYILNNEEYKELMSKADSVQSVKSIATNVITFASVYIKSKDKTNEDK